MGDPIERTGPDAAAPDGSGNRRAQGDLSAVPSFLRAAGSAEPASQGRPKRADLPPTFLPRITALVAPSPPDVAAIPMATISPRRLLQAVALVALAWGVISFGRQVATASAATGHAADLRGANAALQVQVTEMQNELTLIQDQRYVDQQARAFRLGGANEIPFALGPDASPLPVDAPGSAASRLGARSDNGGPLNSWLNVLFGSS